MDSVVARFEAFWQVTSFVGEIELSFMVEVTRPRYFPSASGGTIRRFLRCCLVSKTA